MGREVRFPWLAQALAMFRMAPLGGLCRGRFPNMCTSLDDILPEMRRLFRHMPRDYAEQTYSSPYRIVRYAHQERFRRAVDAVTETGPESILDYGGGDAYFVLELCRRAASPPRRVVVYEPLESMANQAEEQLANLRGELDVDIIVVRERSELVHQIFDAITCLGVLEHAPLMERYAFYETVDRTLAPAGRCVIDVPVEVGPSLVIKHFGRTLLKGREAEVSPHELFHRAAGRTVFDPARFDPTNNRWVHFHSGFDHRILAQELRNRFEVLCSFGSPLRHVPPMFGNQEAFFVVARSWH